MRKHNPLSCCLQIPSQPDVTAALHAQIDDFVQYTSAYTYNEKTIEYAKKLASVYPGGVKAKVCFGNCGSDANDTAIKFIHTDLCHNLPSNYRTYNNFHL